MLKVLKFPYSAFYNILILLILIGCEKDQKNPNVLLEANVGFPYINFKNECTNGIKLMSPGFYTSGSEKRCYADGCWVTREFFDIESNYSNYYYSYNETRRYENGSTYEIKVFDVEFGEFTGTLEGHEFNYRGVLSFKAIVDGVEYSGLDKRYP